MFQNSDSLVSEIRRVSETDRYTDRYTESPIASRRVPYLVGKSWKTKYNEVCGKLGINYIKVLFFLITACYVCPKTKVFLRTFPEIYLYIEVISILFKNMHLKFMSSYAIKWALFNSFKKQRLDILTDIRHVFSISDMVNFVIKGH